MKKNLLSILICTIMMTITACGTHENNIQHSAEINSEIEVEIIEAKNCFDNAGFVEFVSSAKKDAEYTFDAENSEDVEWHVYVFDEEFDDGLRYIKQAKEPTLSENGSILVNKGQYVYVYCSANEFTVDVANEEAYLKVQIDN